jgi:HEAT repeat protein
VIRDLGGGEARAAVPLFVNLLDDPELREEAASAVAHLSASHPHKVIPILVATLREQSGWEDWHTTADDDIAQYGELAIPVWVELLSNRSIAPDFSLRALKTLGPQAMSKAIPFPR